MNQSIPRENGYQSRVWTSNIRLVCWNGASVVTCAVMKFGPRFLWNKALMFTLLAIGLNLCVGVGVILANKRRLAELDELQRKVYLNALAITVGVALIVGVPCTVIGACYVIPFQADIPHLLVIMCLAFSVSFLYGTWRYR
jgi:formate hydrogenlyase subunit 3/multisubunit Na+/H+ antiporter MnhD subunit